MMDYQLSRHETRVVVSTGSVSTAAHHTRGGVWGGGGARAKNIIDLTYLASSKKIINWAKNSLSNKVIS